jgi:hypothetical protein
VGYNCEGLGEGYKHSLWLIFYIFNIPGPYSQGNEDSINKAEKEDTGDLKRDV